MVTVKVFGTEQAARSIDEQVAVAHAKLGFPVQVRIVNGNNSNVMHLSLADAIQLQDGIAAARRGQS